MGGLPPEGGKLLHILAEQTDDLQELERMYYDSGQVWPSGDVVLTKQTKRHTLSLSNAANLGNDQNARGRKGLTSYGKKVVRSACQLIEDRFNVSNCSFLTLTLPQLSDEDLDHVVENWGTIIHNLLRELERECMRHGSHLYYVDVTEIQEKRWLDTKQAYPHLHLVMRGRIARGRDWMIKPVFLSETWLRVIRNALPTTFLATARTGIQRIDSSAVAYISKYLSKGSDSLKSLDSDIPIGRLPSAWYGCTRSILRMSKPRVLDRNSAAIVVTKSLLVSYLARTKKTYLRLSIFDDQTGYSYPIAAIAYIGSKDYRKYLNDCLHNCEPP